MKKVIPFVLTLLLLFGMGCTKSIRYSEEEIKGFPLTIQEHIRMGEVTPGMTQSQVRYSWGSPSSIRIPEPSEEGELREEWVYLNLAGVFKTQVIFTDGMVTEIITNDPGTGIRK